MTTARRAGTALIRFKSLERLQKVLAVTTTRAKGVSKGLFKGLNLGWNTGDREAQVARNRRLLAGALDIKVEQIHSMKQVHGARIRSVSERKTRGRMPVCDGAVTAGKGVFLAVQTADCLAVVAVDEQRHVCGVAHAGWRGALRKIVAGLVKKMKKEYFCRPKDIHVGLSPCIGPCHLTLGKDQHRDFKRSFRKWRSFCTPLKKGQFKLDLWKCAVVQLESEGVPIKNIRTKRLCTFCHPEYFFSYRRDGKKTGRMLTLAGFIQ